jgi:hypothetical protein
MAYLDDKPGFSWTLPLLGELQVALDISVVGGIVDDSAVTASKLQAVGITNFGQLGKLEFYGAMANSFVLIGVGAPRISPSPWDALCMGVPVRIPCFTSVFCDMADLPVYQSRVVS